MQPFDILVWPRDSSILRKKSVAVQKETVPALQEFIDRLIITMYSGNGCGLSAIQVGNNIRLFVMDCDGYGTRIFINPEIVDFDGAETEVMNEGCLSFPGLYEDVERHNRLYLKWLDRNGVECQGVFVGREAQCIQHEIEHLDGKLLSDRISSLKRSRWASAIAKRLEDRP